MHAIVASRAGGPDVLSLIKVPTPSITEHEVLIKVRAAGLNRPDLLQRRGLYPPPKGASTLLGLEVSGEIIACGRSVKNFSIGERVTALLSGGGYAEYAVAHATCTLKMPPSYSFIEAAALPETFFTVWSNLIDYGRLKAGQRLLIHGGAGGIGSAAIQLAKAFGATVIATAGSDEKCVFCQSLGADLSINYRKHEFVTAIEAYSGKNSINIILDMVGGDYCEKNYQIAAPEGRIIQIAFIAGQHALIDLRQLMQKRLIHTGSTLRNRNNVFKGAIARSLKKNLWPLLETGRIKPIIDRIFPLHEAAKAHTYMETGAHKGKIVLNISSN
ncbi:NAD(P)H-quinone oxidoreductase [Bartonella sp. DGB2]|uniref:NAD(P)H-quinone oxidoreductase n=1 Tax=Bartonella sp. DGB2 TaxID=3388426 RepID=UPI0039900CFC